MALGILPAPKYVLSIYSYRRELEKYKEKVRRVKNPKLRDSVPDICSGQPKHFCLRIHLHQRLNPFTPPGCTAPVEFINRRELEKYKEKVRRVKNPKLRDAALKEIEALRRALERADGLEEVFAKHMLPHRNDHVQETEKPEVTFGKYIVFCADYRHLEEMRALMAAKHRPPLLLLNGTNTAKVFYIHYMILKHQ